MYKNIRKKELIRNVVYISIILLVAIISTYSIYYKFVDERKLDSSARLDVTYHDNNGNKLSITKVTPVTDSVGLSTNHYGLTLNNNLTEKVYYKIKITDDVEAIINDKCEEYLISKDNIRISIKAGKTENKIFTLSELNEGILLDESLEALEKKEISIRIWVDQNSTLPLGSNIHYHGLINVIEYTLDDENLEVGD